MNLLNKINISNITYIFLLFSMLAGYFEYMFLLLFFIIIHELGHLIIASILNFKIDKIIIYPFGGLTKFNNLINTEINKELLVAISGPVIQILLFLFLLYLYNIDYINDNVFEKIKLINYSLLYFNLLPIIPLDGSKILSLTFQKFFSFRLSSKTIVIISIVIIILILILNKEILIIVLSLLLMKNIYFEIKENSYKYNKFLLERYMYNFNFKKDKIINKVDDMYKDRSHIIKYGNKYIKEKEYLSKMFDLKGHLW